MAFQNRGQAGFIIRSFSLLVALLTLVSVPVFAGTWTPLVHTAPGGLNLMLLLSDGTVMAARNNGSTIGKSWNRLTPDIHGSYVNGTWTTLPNAADTRLYYSSQVLMDGRVFIAGGEYGTGGAKAEIYNPLTNSWTQVNPPTSLLDPSEASPVNGSPEQFYDSNSEILPDGSVLIAPVLPKVSGQPLIYNPATNTWAAGPNYFRGVYQDEASWVKLPDNSILTLDPFGRRSERYIPSSNVWVNDGISPVSLYDSFGSELGAALLLPNGKAFFLGSTGHTALYTPTGTTSPGTWVAGPDIPGAHGTPDAPAAMMVTGNILCAVSPVPTSADHFPPPTSFYEYDPFANAFTAVGAPTGATDNTSPYATAMLDLPDGTVLYSHMANQLYDYQPSGAPLAAGKPTISSITPNGDGSYHLVGTGLNGISEGAAYGDDLQMASNYPLVRLTSGANVYYARTFNWSSTSVMTGATPLSTEFTLPAGLPFGAYSLVVTANGNPSDPVPFSTCALSVVSIPNGAAGCGISYTSPAPSTTGSSGTVTWSLGAGAPGGMTIDPGTGVVSWPGPVATGSPFTITTIATDSCGNSSKNWTLSVTLGDFDADGLVTLNDLPGFVNDLLTDPGLQVCAGDLNGDGAVDGLDIQLFDVALGI